MNTFEKDSTYIAHAYGRLPVEFARASGSEVFGSDGKRYIDLGSGIAVNIFGHCDPVWTAAVEKQLHTFAHTSNYYYSAPQADLAERLCTRTGMARVFFSNSGAEANECAIKTARKYAFDKYGKGRSTIVTLTGSFHGRTMATLAATGQDAFHNYFFPFPEGFAYTPANDAEALKAALDGSVCALLLEMVQGEGGVNVLDRDFVQTAAALCAERDVLLLVDEVQTGNGRTGTLYAYEQFGVKPDILTTAKGLGGGLPIGATLLGGKTAGTLTPSSHGSTFGGNPVCAAGALSVIDRIDDALLAGVRRKGAYIREKLEKHPAVGSVSGMGLMLGIQTKKDAKAVCARALEKGLLVLTAKDKVRLLPALNIPDPLLEEGLEILQSILDE
ncbi:MAG TPA: aspartate aminotransferase family protein [Firmicutes bacterium]|nr:aspartate aminotransferase family protein [Bacillota bacterium]